jgi:hypothetical protein
MTDSTTKPKDFEKPTPEVPSATSALREQADHLQRYQKPDRPGHDSRSNIIDHAELAAKAKDIHDALHRHWFLNFGNHPDVDKAVMDINSLKTLDRKQIDVLSQSYDEQFGNGQKNVLVSDIKQYLDTTADQDVTTHLHETAELAETARTLHEDLHRPHPDVEKVWEDIKPLSTLNMSQLDELCAIYDEQVGNGRKNALITDIRQFINANSQDAPHQSKRTSQPASSTGQQDAPPPPTLPTPPTLN